MQFPFACQSGPRTSSRAEVVLVFLVVVTLSVAIVPFAIRTTLVAGLRHHSVPQDPPKLYVESAFLDLGGISPAEVFHKTVPIRNGSNIPATILRFEASCGCTVVSPSSVTVPPYGEASMELQVHPGAIRQPAKKALLPLALTVTPVLPAFFKRSEPISFHGTIHYPFVVESRVAVFCGADSLLVSEQHSVKTIPGRLFDSSLCLSIASEDRDCIARLSAPNAHGDFVLDIEPRHDQVGPFSHRVIVTASRMGQRDAVWSVPIDVIGESRAPYHLVPSILTLGTQAQGSAVERRIHLVNIDGKVIQVSAIDDDVSARMEELNDTEHATIVITTRIAHAGSHSTRFHIIYETNGGQIISHYVPVLYHGIAPVANLQSGPWNR